MRTIKTNWMKLGVHGVANVLLWYCEIIKVRGSNGPLFLLAFFL
nr:MAG TPA: hypothetical protein [Caudoviricetes sp.]